MSEEGNKIHGVLETLSTFMMGYGYLIVVTNRTRYTLLIPLESSPRLNLGLVMFLVGWVFLFLRYGFTRDGKRRRR